MQLKQVRPTTLLVSLLLITPGPTAAWAAGGDAESRGFWVPDPPPQARYVVECQIDPAQGATQGSETIHFKNETGRSLRRLVLSWMALRDQESCVLEVTAGNRPVTVVQRGAKLVFDLPQPLSAGTELTLEVRFNFTPSEPPDGEDIVTSEFLPRLAWGVSTHDDYDVQLNAPPEYAVATSGRLDPQTGRYRAEHVREFGLFLGKGYEVSEAEAGDVLVRVIHRPAAAPCAKLLLATATDAIGFYRERFGFYPYRILNIIPGMPQPAGGWPLATGIVGIHGQERFDHAPELHWRWIMAHEIGHQYWGEYVLEKDSPGWLWIGLGIYADRQYVRARGLGLGKHDELKEEYTEGLQKGLDTTIALPPEQARSVSFDFNNVVIHGKGFSVISALACCLGPETFDRIYVRCLKEYAGRRLGAAEFQAVCQAETGQDLGWFFEQWVHSNRQLRYEITAQESAPQGQSFVTRVRVEKRGDLAMPVPVVARFEDGSQQRQFTDRALDVNQLEFESRSPLKDVRIDPDGELAMASPLASATSRPSTPETQRVAVAPAPAEPPAPLSAADEKNVAKAIAGLPWEGAGPKAVEVFLQARAAQTLDAESWGKLGLTLYDGKHYPEALTAFERSAKAAGEKDVWGFVALVWQGHILDLTDRREDALGRYRAALERDTGKAMQHGQYGMTINRKWVERRLEKQFQRK